MTDLDLTVLLFEGPIARAYLAMMRRQGLRPRRILVMLPSTDPATGKKVGGRFLPGAMRRGYLKSLHDQRMNAWPRRLMKEQPALFGAMRDVLVERWGIDGDLFTETTAPPRFETYADRVDQVVVSGWKDPALPKALGDEPGTVLYTGGGIVPAEVLNLPGLVVLHVHPGHLPFVRGADGLLWSTLVRGRPGASAFHMAPGIDTGDLVRAEDLPPVAFPLAAGEAPDDDTLYRALFSFCDPVLRGWLLCRLLAEDPDVANHRGRAQDTDAGITYHFMHVALRRRALARLFVASGS